MPDNAAIPLAESSVPHLTTALSGPLQPLERDLLARQTQIESWFRRQWRATPPPFYASVDIRNAGFKIAPVDTNLFPAGFNNLNRAFAPLCVQAVQQAVEGMGIVVDRILVVPENHTRNPYYAQHLATLRGILEQAGFETRIGRLPGAKAAAPAPAAGDTEPAPPLERHGNRLRAGDFDPELILLNNDLSSGRPPILEGLEQRVAPSPYQGWSERSKALYFSHYRRVAAEFAAFVGLEDPWLLEPLCYDCGAIDFMKREGEHCLQTRVAALLEEIGEKYRRYGVASRPFVVLKADTGTYGMAVMTVRSPEEALQLNRKQRSRMATVKEGQKVTRVLIQEGVFTRETWGNPERVAEPVVYTVGNRVVGGFYRVHNKRGAEENLNAPGMYFQPLAFADCCQAPGEPLAESPREAGNDHGNRFYPYGVVGRLAALAAARETAALLSRTAGDGAPPPTAGGSPG